MNRRRVVDPVVKDNARLKPLKEKGQKIKKVAQLTYLIDLADCLHHMNAPEGLKDPTLCLHVDKNEHVWLGNGSCLPDTPSRAMLRSTQNVTKQWILVLSFSPR